MKKFIDVMYVLLNLTLVVLSINFFITGSIRTGYILAGISVVYALLNKEHYTALFKKSPV